MNSQFLKKFLGILGVLMLISAAAPIKTFACGEGSENDANPLNGTTTTPTTTTTTVATPAG